VDGGPAADVGEERGGTAEDIIAADDDGEDDKVDKSYRFDYAAYRAVWKDTPIDVAVTAMFAEYALLYSRMSRLTTSSVPPPMTMSEGISIGQQAADFVNNFVTPILGEVISTKVHKLLCHVVAAVRLHGNLQNCNTDTNESGHKDDKPFYKRTNGDLALFTDQLVRQAHGTRAQLAKIEREDATTITANRVKLAMLAADAATTAASAASTASAATAAATDQGAKGTSSDGGEADATAEQAQRDAATAAAASATAAAALLAANK